MSSIGIFFIKMISKLPFGILYRFSWFLSNVLLRIVPYRKKVIDANLVGAFPEKSKNELISLRKKYYSFFSNLVIESVKSFSISREAMKKRVTFENLDMAESYLKKGKSVIIVMGHHGNWEWLWLSYTINSKYACAGVYKPLSSKKFDDYFLKSRAKFGGALIPMKKTHEYIQENINKKPFTIGFASDQAPPPEKGYWLNFMNRGTPVFPGLEIIAKQHDLAVVFLSLEVKKQGFYHAKMQLITDDAKNTTHGWITEQHTKLLEETINKKPEFWIWTHKRWKHTIPKNIPPDKISKKYPPNKADRIDY